jgi:hypothetical protein
MDDDFWFPAKRYGWGWGLPVKWQGLVRSSRISASLRRVFFGSLQGKASPVS